MLRLFHFVWMTWEHVCCPCAQPLTLLPLVALIFYDVSGGPFGIEVRLPTLLISSAAKGLALPYAAAGAPRDHMSSACCLQQRACIMGICRTS